MKKITTSFAVGAALMSGIASADVNPFGVTELPSGYMQLAEAEMSCGANMKMEPPKTAEGACAAKKSEPATKGSEGKSTEAAKSSTKAPEPKK